MREAFLPTSPQSFNQSRVTAREAASAVASHMMINRVNVALWLSSRKMPKAEAVYQDTPETAPEIRKMATLLRETP